MKKLTNDPAKMKIVARLVKEGAVDFEEAIKLLEVEVEKEYVFYPSIQEPFPPYQPMPIWYQSQPYQVTCDASLRLS